MAWVLGIFLLLLKLFCFGVDGFKCNWLCETLGCVSFILLNLLFSTQAAYAPIIMMAQIGKQNAVRAQAEADYKTTLMYKLEMKIYNAD
ncbi:MAG: DUF1003 domain-containing protein [Chitinophagales bacterium]